MNIWSLATREVVQSLEAGWGQPLRDLQYLPSHEILVGLDSGIAIWDLRTGTARNTKGESDHLYAVERPAFAISLTSVDPHSSAEVVVGSDKGNIEVWDLVHRVRTGTFPQQKRQVDSLCIVEVDGQSQIVAGTRDGLIQIFDYDSQQVVHRLQGHRGGVYSLCSFRLDQDPFIASGGGDKILRVWNARTGKQVARSQKLSGLIHKVCALSQGENLLLAVLAGDSLLFISPRGELCESHHGVGVFRAFGGACVLNENGRETVATADISGAVKLWVPQRQSWINRRNLQR